MLADVQATSGIKHCNPFRICSSTLQKFFREQDVKKNVISSWNWAKKTEITYLSLFPSDVTNSAWWHISHWESLCHRRAKGKGIIVWLVSIASSCMHDIPLRFLIPLLARPNPSELMRSDRNVFWVAYVQVITINCRKLMCLIPTYFTVLPISFCFQ